MNAPKIQSGNWVIIGSYDAVVCNVIEQSGLSLKAEVVYLDRDRAINENAVWKKGKWYFESSGVVGGYADNYPRLRQFVSQLRSGRHY